MSAGVGDPDPALPPWSPPLTTGVGDPGPVLPTTSPPALTSAFTGGNGPVQSRQVHVTVPEPTPNLLEVASSMSIK
ncbi:MAG: hypothetical protein V4568_10770 [Pseudomonadota bacterium]